MRALHNVHTARRSESIRAMSRVLHRMPVGERVGIAFSGGLDTSAAVAWIGTGRRPLRLHRRPRPVRRARPLRRPRPGQGVRRGAGPGGRLPGAARHEGLVALQCGAFHIATAGRTYFNTTPLGRAVTGTLLVQAMQDDGVDIWGDGSTYKGNDIERFYRYGLLPPALASTSLGSTRPS